MKINDDNQVKIISLVKYKSKEAAFGLPFPFVRVPSSTKHGLANSRDYFESVLFLSAK